MRGTAAKALGGLGASSAPALDRLLELTRDEDRDVRRAAAEALGRIMARGVRIFKLPVWKRLFRGNRVVRRLRTLIRSNPRHPDLVTTAVRSRNNPDAMARRVAAGPCRLPRPWNVRSSPSPTESRLTYGGGRWNRLELQGGNVPARPGARSRGAAPPREASPRSQDCRIRPLPTPRDRSARGCGTRPPMRRVAVARRLRMLWARCRASSSS